MMTHKIMVVVCAFLFCEFAACPLSAQSEAVRATACDSWCCDAEKPPFETSVFERVVKTARKTLGLPSCACQSEVTIASPEPLLVRQVPAGQQQMARVITSDPLPALRVARMRLAGEIADHFSSKKSSKQEMYDVLMWAMEFTAENARLATISQSPQAMASRLAWQPTLNQPLNVGCQQPSAPINPSNAEVRDSLEQLQNSMLALSKSVEQLSQQVSQNDQRLLQVMPSQRKQIAWASTPRNSDPRVIDEKQTIRQLKQRIFELEQNLRQTTAAQANNNMPRPFAVSQTQSPRFVQNPYYRPDPSSAYRNDFQVQQAWHSAPLQPTPLTAQPLSPISNQPSRLIPQYSRNSPLSPRLPEARRLVTKTYYVGDFLTPPFTKSTLQLIHLIKSRIDPDSWSTARIELAGPAFSIIVSQTPQNHRALSQLLNDLPGNHRALNDPDSKNMR